MRKAFLICVLALAGCAEPAHYAYPPPYVAPVAPPPPRPRAAPAYVAPTPQARDVKPLGAGLLTAKNVGGYIDAEEREFRTDLRGSGVGVSRPGDAITLFVRSDILFLWDSTSLSARGEQVLSAIAAVAEKYDSTALSVNGYTDTAGPPERGLQISQQRADAVARALASSGVDARRIASHGFGSAHLKIPTGPGVSEARNRRIEIVISPKMAG